MYRKLLRQVQSLRPPLFLFFWANDRTPAGRPHPVTHKWQLAAKDKVSVSSVEHVSAHVPTALGRKFTHAIITALESASKSIDFDRL
jgi:hypothetical protein